MDHKQCPTELLIPLIAILGCYFALKSMPSLLSFGLKFIQMSIDAIDTIKS